MQALILAGGEGTRLRPLTLHTPKPIVPIVNQPFLLRQIELLKKAGINEIILSLNYQPSAIEAVLGDGSTYGVKLRYLIEPEPLGTAGAYKFAERFLHSSTIVLNGDILTDIELQKVVEQHQNIGSMATIVLTPVADPAAYGLVQLDGLKVERFLEKPTADEIARLRFNTINAGIYVLEPEVLNLIPAGQKYSFEYGLFPDLLARNKAFHGYVADDFYWIDIGTPERYLQAHRDLLNNVFKGFNSQNDSVIAEGCRIDSTAKISHSVVGKNVIIGAHSTVTNSVIWDGVRVGDNSHITGCAIGKNSRIGANISLAEGSVLGDETVVD